METRVLPPMRGVARMPSVPRASPCVRRPGPPPGRASSWVRARRLLRLLLRLVRLEGGDHPRGTDRQDPLPVDPQRPIGGEDTDDRGEGQEAPVALIHSQPGRARSRQQLGLVVVLEIGLFRVFTERPGSAGVDDFLTHGIQRRTQSLRRPTNCRRVAVAGGLLELFGRREKASHGFRRGVGGAFRLLEALLERCQLSSLLLTRARSDAVRDHANGTRPARPRCFNLVYLRPPPFEQEYAVTVSAPPVAVTHAPLEAHRPDPTDALAGLHGLAGRVVIAVSRRESPRRAHPPGSPVWKPSRSSPAIAAASPWSNVMRTRFPPNA